jgi:hypothetical protein
VLAPARGSAIAHPPESPELAAGATQCPEESHTFGGVQSSTVLHVEPHAPVVVHRYGAQSFVTPSVLTEVRASRHVAPETHWPCVHWFPDAQSALDEHVVLHAVAPHA